MWSNLFDLGVSVPDKLLRTVAVYVAIAVLLRIAGKRDLAQLNSFDLVVMLLLSNVVQNAIIGPDNSLTGGLLGAVFLLAINAVVVRVTRRSDRAAALFEGTPTVLARDGAWLEPELRHEGLRRADLETAIRRQNATDIDDVEQVVLEAGGSLVVTMRPGALPASAADVARLEAKLDLLLAARPGGAGGAGSLS